MSSTLGCENDLGRNARYGFYALMVRFGISKCEESIECLEDFFLQYIVNAPQFINKFPWNLGFWGPCFSTQSMIAKLQLLLKFHECLVLCFRFADKDLFEFGIFCS